MRLDDLAIESAEALLRFLNVGGERCLIEFPGGTNGSDLVLLVKVNDFVGND